MRTVGKGTGGWCDLGGWCGGSLGGKSGPRPTDLTIARQW